MLPTKILQKTVKIKAITLEFDTAKPDQFVEKEIHALVETINTLLKQHLPGPLPQLSIEDKKLKIELLPIINTED